MNHRTQAGAWLAVGAAVVTVALTGAAFWLSFEHLHDVAAANGLGRDPSRAWAWPATVDLFIVAGELLILRASLAGRVDRWAITLAGTGSLGSIALNVAGVRAGAPPLWYVVAAVPPVAALLAFGALMRQVHQALAAREAAPPGVQSRLDPTSSIETIRAVPEAVPPGVQSLPIVAGTTTAAAAGEGRPYPRTLLPVPEPVPAGVQPVDRGDTATVAVPAQRTRTAMVAVQPADQAFSAFTEEGPAAEESAGRVPSPIGESGARYVPEPGDDSPPPPAEDLLTPAARVRYAGTLTAGRTPSIRVLRTAYSIGQPRAQRIQRELGTPPAAVPDPAVDVLFPVGS